MIGEARHRRSFLYDLDDRAHARGSSTTTPSARSRPSIPVDRVRTRTARKLLIVAERDGDTVSPERGVYLVDLTRKVTKAELVRASRRNLAARARAARQQANGCSRRSPRRSRRRSRRGVGRRASTRYEKALFDFDSKHISRPGNKLAVRVSLRDVHSRSATRPSYQWFDARQARSAARPPNVVATLKGTVNPELVYVVSSHYDSVAIGPGRRRRHVGDRGAARDGARPGGASAAGDDRLRVVHRRGGGPARQPRVRAPRGRRAR